LNGVQRAALQADAVDPDLGRQRLDYLRGDRSLEAPDGPFRSRGSRLGDNINSMPAVVGTPNAGYPAGLEAVDYAAFVAANDDTSCFDAQGNRRTAGWEREPMVYFGANDGMLHGVSACSGEERLAFVPDVVFPYLAELASPSYDHRYYVDGSPTVMDAFWSGAWRTVLVGTTRAGGKGVFALDVTDPARFDEAYADEIVLWELQGGPLGTDFAHLGYTFSQPAVVKAKGVGWVALFGNGYASATGSAALFVVRIDTGELVQPPLVLDAGPDNGLSTVAPIDSDGDGEVDLLYAGDLKGNLWRVAADDNGFSNASRLYAAKADATRAQAITVRPEVGRHPTKGRGRMVYFGTGRYFADRDADPANAVPNSVYGLYDDDSGATIPTVTNRDSSVLQKQLVETLPAQVFGSDEAGNVTLDVRTLSDRPVTWVTEGLSTCGNANPARDQDPASEDDYLQCGWYFDLPALDAAGDPAGEKVVANPVLLGGRLTVVTILPGGASCEDAGDGWLMEVAADNGGRIDNPVFELNGDGVFGYGDMIAPGERSAAFTAVSGRRAAGGLSQPPASIAGVGGRGDGAFGKTSAKYVAGSADGEPDLSLQHNGLLSGGRQSWTQLR
jgi:type IV pilus assembly protein PilY1